MKLARRTLLSAVTAAALVPVARAKASQIKGLQTTIEKSIQGDGVLRLGAGTWRVSGLRIAAALRLEGVSGQTKLVGDGGGPILTIADTAEVSISGIDFEGGDAPPATEDALVVARNVTGLRVSDCRFSGFPGSGLRLEGCSGRIAANRFAKLGITGLLALDSKGLEISGNEVADIGNNGIQVWTSEPTEDGTIVTNNRVRGISATQGGDGQNGNGINIYRAGNVMVAGNRISECAFSAIRNNAGSNCQIVNNSVSRCREVSIYCEFGFEGAVVTGNLIEDVAFGISITNFNEGGRLAVCANNVVRNVSGGVPSRSGTGIAAEADTLVTGNVVENARDNGIWLGWGKYCRNLAASGNLVRNCGRGIGFSASAGAEPVMITGNRIAGAAIAAIQGMDHERPATGDLGLPGATLPGGAVVSGNFVS
ncbi:MAG: TIGR03808 family TAT-translocated repetitive protein [Rhizobiales bacterium]|nr:TIGR03808 family TAT-translocated repetitive protein [Hyphomicrobiales bacterium]